MDKSLYRIAPPVAETEIDISAKQHTSHKASKRTKMIISLITYLVVIPAIIVIGVLLFNDRKYNIVSIMIAICACVPFFISFEKSNKTGARELVVISVMSAISVLGRLIFAPMPGFKPVTAIVIITAIGLGANAGFLTGALSAIVSNIFFGQGPWTPFQMFSWGFLGLITGLIFRRNDEKPNVVLLIIIGIIGGIIYSIMMDVWGVINMDGAWNWGRYLASLVSSLPFMATYAISNVVFLLILTKPFLQKLNRLKIKYKLFSFR